MHQKTFPLLKLKTEQDALLIQETLLKTTGIRQAMVDFESKNLLLQFESEIISLVRIKEIIQQLGFDLDLPIC